MVPVPWQRRGHTGPKASTVVRRWIGTCSVTKELKAGGTDDVCVSGGWSVVSDGVACGGFAYASVWNVGVLWVFNLNGLS